MLPQVKEALDRLQKAKEKEVQAIEEQAKAKRDETQAQRDQTNAQKALDDLRLELTKNLDALGGPLTPPAATEEPPPPPPAPLRNVVPDATDEAPPVKPNAPKRDLDALPSNVAPMRPLRVAMRLHWEADGIKDLLPVQCLYVDFLLLSGAVNSIEKLEERLQAFCSRHKLPKYNNRKNLATRADAWVNPGKGGRKPRLKKVITHTDKGRKVTYEVLPEMDWHDDDRNYWQTGIDRRNKWLLKEGKPELSVPGAITTLLELIDPKRASKSKPAKRASKSKPA